MILNIDFCSIFVNINGNTKSRIFDLCLFLTRNLLNINNNVKTVEIIFHAQTHTYIHQIQNHVCIKNTPKTFTTLADRNGQLAFEFSLEVVVGINNTQEVRSRMIN